MSVAKNFELICKRAKEFKINTAELAYIFATVQHETAGTFEPIEEYGGKHTRYAPWYGRGFVQLTWQPNYEKYAKIFGIPLGDGSWALEPDKAAYILVHGMKTGAFTTKRLNQYIHDGVRDYVGARRIINGTDKASLIAGYAEKWFTKLSKGEVKEWVS
jgi:hypothetical protein